MVLLLILPQNTPCLPSSSLPRLSRPLSAELLHYARTDVHHLLYIAGVLRAELAAKGGGAALAEAERRSHDVSLALYAKPTSEVMMPLPVFVACH